MVKQANRWFDGLERRLEGRDWIACADFTIADILLATVLRDIRKSDLVAPYPRLTAYYARALARPAWRHTLSLYPYWGRQTDEGLNELTDRLLDAHRPRAAFHTVHMDWPRIETSRLKCLLLAVATVDAEPAGSFQFNEHDISAALKSLDGRAGVSSDELAHLEFMFIGVLSHGKRGIPHLERQVAESPLLRRLKPGTHAYWV